MAMDLMGLRVGGRERGARAFLWSVKAMPWWREQTRRRMGGPGALKRGAIEFDCC